MKKPKPHSPIGTIISPEKIEEKPISSTSTDLKIDIQENRKVSSLQKDNQYSSLTKSDIKSDVKLEGSDETLNELNDRFREIIVIAAGGIPDVGFLVSILISQLWPVSSKDIWALVMQKVAQLIDAKILAYEIQQQQSTINGLKDTMRQYSKAKNHERGGFMTSMLTNCNILYEQLIGSSNDIHLISLTVATAHIHLTLLRERATQGTKIFGEDNSSVWNTELLDQYKIYRQYFIDIYSKWKEWRYKQIEARWYTTKDPMPFPPFFTWTAHGDVYDKFTEYSLKNARSLTNDPDCFKAVSQAVADRLIGDLNAKMINVLSSTYYLNVYCNDIPGIDNQPATLDPQLEKFCCGPYSTLTLSPGSSGYDYEDPKVIDEPGKIKQIYLREWNSIDGMQFIYNTHEGNFVGSRTGGLEHNISIDQDKYLCGLRMLFSKGLMASVEFLDSSSKYSVVYGNRSQWSGWVADGNVDADYAMVSVKYSQGSGPSGTTGIGAIKLYFLHKSLLESLQLIIKQKEKFQSKKTNVVRINPMPTLKLPLGDEKGTSKDESLELKESDIALLATRPTPVLNKKTPLKNNGASLFAGKETLHQKPLKEINDSSCCTCIIS